MTLPANRPLVYLITRGEATPLNFVHTAPEILKNIKAAVDEGVDLIQIREKQLFARQLEELVCNAEKITRSTPTRLLVNDRADIALAANADGVHLASNSIPTSVIRESFPAKFIIGVSTHTVPEALAVSTAGADFVVFGPVFETDSKPTAGLNELRRACETLTMVPVLALGGINADNYRSALDVGADGIAAIRALNEIDPLRAICREIKK